MTDNRTDLSEGFYAVQLDPNVSHYAIFSEKGGTDRYVGLLTEEAVDGWVSAATALQAIVDETSGRS